MRIVSLNAWGGARWDELRPWVREVDADLLCLQEVTRTAGASGWTSFADDHRALPQRADLCADVAGELPGHDAWFTVCDSGPVEVDGTVLREHFGIASFARAGLARVRSREEFVHGRYASHEVWPHSDRPRAAQVARYVGPGRPVTVGHLHGLRTSEGKGDTVARLAQAERLAALVDAVREPDDLVVVCGDLNLLPDSATFDVLAGIGLTDLVGDRDTRTSLYPKPMRSAGYLLVSDPSAVSSFEIVRDPEVSDHRALVLDV